MHPRLKLVASAAGAATLLLAALTPTAAAGSGGGTHSHDRHHSHHHYALKALTTLEQARGLDALGDGYTVVSEADGTISMVVERRRGPARTVELTSVAPGFIAPAVAVGRDRTVYILTSAGPPGSGAATLYTWRAGWDAPRVLADIGAHQAADPDPYNQESVPEESNPFGLAALPHGGVLVADAAGNDLLKVSRSGEISTVARFKPRTVEVPDNLPPPGPESPPNPPAGTDFLSESVPTSVAVGPRGEMYVGELRGFPATPGTSQVWRIAPGAVDATCDPERPYHGKCTRYADGLTSVVDVAVDRRGAVYALSLSKMGWLQWEAGTAGADVGGLFRITKGHRSGHKRHGHHHHGWTRVHELLADQLVLPGSVDTVGREIYLIAPTFGPSTLSKIVVKKHRHRHHRHHH